MNVVSFRIVPVNTANLKSPLTCVRRINKRKLWDIAHETSVLENFSRTLEKKKWYKCFSKGKGHMWKSAYKLQQVLHQVFKPLLHTWWESINIFDSLCKSKNVTNKERMPSRNPMLGVDPELNMFRACKTCIENLGHGHNSSRTSELQSPSFIQQAFTD